jgi:predicted transcriptional regulator
MRYKRNDIERTKKGKKLLDMLLDMSAKNPEITPDRVLIVEISNKNIDKLFTPKRREVLEVIRHKNPKTIGEISKLTSRPVESITRDLKVLENYGLIELVQAGKTKVPKAEKDFIMIPV